MSTPTQITHSHQAAITSITESVVKTVGKLLRQADTSDIDGWFDRNKSEIIGLIIKAYETNRTFAGLYLNSHAKANQTYTEVYRAFINEPAVWRSIQATGPARFKRFITAGADPETAIESMIKAVNGAVQRHSYAGSRDTIRQTIQRSTTIRGWRRVARGKSCAFCLMLISRGAVYSKETVNFQAHDNDDCLPEPLYRREEEPANVKRLQELWNETTADYNGVEKLNAFRRAVYADNPGG